jgi:hypothetical protein
MSRQEQREAGLQDLALGKELGKSKSAVAMSMKRLRNRYRDLVRTEVRETCRTPEDFHQEWSALMAAL